MSFLSRLLGKSRKNIETTVNGWSVVIGPAAKERAGEHQLWNATDEKGATALLTPPVGRSFWSCKIHFTANCFACGNELTMEIANDSSGAKQSIFACPSCGSRMFLSVLNADRTFYLLGVSSMEVSEQMRGSDSRQVDLTIDRISTDDS